jgi:hypothetical protein
MENTETINVWIKGYRNDNSAHLLGKLGQPIAIRKALWETARSENPKNPARELKSLGLSADEIDDIRMNHNIEPPQELVEALEKKDEGNVLDSFQFEDATLDFEKKSIDEIIELTENIDVEKAAEEVLTWLTDSVIHFIDNKDKFFRLDLVIDEECAEGMGNIKLLQDLYRALPEDSEFVDVSQATADNFSDVDDHAFNDLVECRVVLNDITKRVHESMRSSKKLEELFKAMIFYYEMVGINEGRPLLKKLSGSVDILEFDYEAFSVGVKVLGGYLKMEDDIMNTEVSKQTIRQYTIPEGFTIALEISYVDRARSLTLF